MPQNERRFALRATIAGLLALFSSLAASTFGSDLQLGEVFLAIASGLGGAGAYLGIGAGSANVEPTIGRQ